MGCLSNGVAMRMLMLELWFIHQNDREEFGHMSNSGHCEIFEIRWWKLLLCAYFPPRFRRMSFKKIVHSVWLSPIYPRLYPIVTETWNLSNAVANELKRSMVFHAVRRWLDLLCVHWNAPSIAVWRHVAPPLARSADEKKLPPFALPVITQTTYCFWRRVECDCNITGGV